MINEEKTFLKKTFIQFLFKKTFQLALKCSPFIQSLVLIYERSCCVIILELLVNLHSQSLEIESAQILCFASR